MMSKIMSPAVGEMAPDFELSDEAGHQHKLSEALRAASLKHFDSTGTSGDPHRSYPLPFLYQNIMCIIQRMYDDDRPRSGGLFGRSVGMPDQAAGSHRGRCPFSFLKEAVL
jgi:hypothetical protein